MQAIAKAAAVCKLQSAVPGVTYDKRSGRWTVKTLQRWNVKPRKIISTSSQEEEEAIPQAYFSRLEAAAAKSRFEKELAAVKAELRVQIQ